MGEPDIKLARIDNRLIHGQVATQWNGTLGTNLILVANDEVAGNKMRQGLMDMAAPNGVATRYFTLQKTIDVIHKASASQHIFLVAENPEDVLTLVKGGVPIKKVNIGNMHMAEGKKTEPTTLALYCKDVSAFREVQDVGVTLEIRRVPTTPVEDISKLFE